MPSAQRSYVILDKPNVSSRPLVAGNENRVIQASFGSAILWCDLTACSAYRDPKVRPDNMFAPHNE